jgi:hypothetical protein
MRVRVFDPTVAPIPGAQVTVEPQKGPQIYQGLTDGTGVFTENFC